MARVRDFSSVKREGVKKEAKERASRMAKRPRALTPKQAKFVEVFLATNNATEAARQAYSSTSISKDKDMHNTGYQALKSPIIQETIEQVQKSIADSISDKLLIEKHLELLNAQKITRTRKMGGVEEVEEQIDTQAISKGLDMAYKLKGSYAAEKKVNLNVDYEISDNQYEQIIRTAAIARGSGSKSSS